MAQCAALIAPYARHTHRKPSDYKDLLLRRVPYSDNSAVRIGPTGDEISLNSPRFRGLGQFSLYILSLRRRAARAPFQQRNCVADEPVERRERAGGHDVEWLGRRPDKILDSRRVDN